MDKILGNYFYRNTFPKTNKMGAKWMTTFLITLPTKAKIFSTVLDSPWQVVLLQEPRPSALGSRTKWSRFLKSEKNHVQTLLNSRKIVKKQPRSLIKTRWCSHWPNKSIFWWIRWKFRKLKSHSTWLLKLKTNLNFLWT